MPLAFLVPPWMAPIRRAIDRICWLLFCIIRRTPHFPVLLTQLRAVLTVEEPSAGELLYKLKHCTYGPKRFKDLVALSLYRYPDQLGNLQLSVNELTMRGSPICSPFPGAHPVALQQPNS
eukprot:EG_transcript_54340